MKIRDKRKKTRGHQEQKRNEALWTLPAAALLLLPATAHVSAHSPSRPGLVPHSVVGAPHMTAFVVRRCSRFAFLRFLMRVSSSVPWQREFGRKWPFLLSLTIPLSLSYIRTFVPWFSLALFMCRLEGHFSFPYRLPTLLALLCRFCTNGDYFASQLILSCFTRGSLPLCFVFLCCVVVVLFLCHILLARPFQSPLLTLSSCLPGHAV